MQLSCPRGREAGLGVDVHLSPLNSLPVLRNKFFFLPVGNLRVLLGLFQ